LTVEIVVKVAAGVDIARIDKSIATVRPAGPAIGP
jgi:hypothetical protein